MVPQWHSATVHGHQAKIVEVKTEIYTFLKKKSIVLNSPLLISFKQKVFQFKFPFPICFFAD